MRRLPWRAALAALAGAALGVALASLRPGPHSDLYPDKSAVRYRFLHSKSRAAGPDPIATIRALEAREQGAGAAPLDPIEMAELADLYFQRGLLTGDVQAYERAETLARRSLERLRWPNPATLTLAKLAGARHEFGEAIARAREFLARKRSGGALAVLVSSYLALGELDKAAQAAEEAVALRPDSSAYLLRALVMQAQGRDAEAAFDFTHAAIAEDFNMTEESARLRALWGRFLLRRGELAGAKLLFDEALRIVPNHALALDLQGELALRQGRLKEARSLFEQAFESSKQLRYLIDEARARELSGDRTSADAVRGQVERIIRAELGQGQSGHSLELVEILVDRGRPADIAEAVALGRAELEKRPGPDVRFQLARALAGSGDSQQALAQLRELLATGAREAQIYELAATLERRSGNPARATLYAGLAEKLDPGASGWRRLGLPGGEPQPQIGKDGPPPAQP